MKKYILFSLLLAIATQGTWATVEGIGSVDDPYRIGSTEDWESLRGIWEESYESFKDSVTPMYIRLDADITINNSLGTTDKPLNMAFDGNGHTITANLTNGYGVFVFVNYAQIKNLHVAGSISGGHLFGALVCHLQSGANGDVEIENCCVSATVIGSKRGEETPHVSGFIGSANGGTVTIKGCVFDGTLTADEYHASSYGGAFIAWDALPIGTTLIDCIEMGTYSYLDHTDLCYSIVGTTSTSDYDFTNCYRMHDLNVGKGWYLGECAYTVKSGTNGLTLDFGEAVEEYGDNGMKAFDFDNGSGLLHQGTLYTGGSAKVTFKPVMPKGYLADEVWANGTTLTANDDGTYTVDMSSTNVIITASKKENPYGLMRLDDDQDNTYRIEESADQAWNVTIKGRTLYKDGTWNTLCLPFSVNAEKMSAESHPLHGAVIKQLDVDSKADDGSYKTGFDTESGTLHLYFKDATEIEAGMPYIVKWTITGENIQNPTFNVSIIESGSPMVIKSADEMVSFLGIYDPMSITGEDRTKLYLGGDNKVNYPNAAMKLNSFRAYFQFDNSMVGSSLGDVNGDGTITVTDLILLVDYVLGKNVTIIIDNADVNGDGDITMLDVTGLVDIILHSEGIQRVVVNIEAGDTGISFAGGGNTSGR